ncbi:MAG: hypothetical protein J0G32_04340 [Alphaproteobacteria bacterium]|nr:hypothetical protein [Alphaproteobacteria bacterium]OJV13672.1 MAG: hypothetical protein BGO27_00675 [Alphaproteobacteria bacterium 33-17]
MQKGTVGVIGAGDIGFNIAEVMALKGHDVIVYNRYHEVDGKPGPYWLSKMGIVMDINDSLQLPGAGSVCLVHDLDKLSNVDYIVITAGAKRSSPEETREELAGKNAKIIAGFAELISKNSKALTLIVTNPIDFLARYLIEEVAKVSGKKLEEVAKKIVGVSYVDTMRLKNAVKEFLEIHHPEVTNPIIEGIALGEHGPAMVPIMSQVTVNARPLTDFANEDQIEAIRKQTVLRGNDIIKLTGASSVMGPAHAVCYMIEQIDLNPRVQLPCSVWDNGSCIGKLVEFLARQAHKILQVTKSDLELEMMKKCKTTLDAQYNAIIGLLKK